MERCGAVASSDDGTDRVTELALPHVDQINSLVAAFQDDQPHPIPHTTLHFVCPSWPGSRGLLSLVVALAAALSLGIDWLTLSTLGICLVPAVAAAATAAAAVAGLRTIRCSSQHSTMTSKVSSNPRLALQTPKKEGPSVSPVFKFKRGYYATAVPTLDSPG
ncbi:hypothetical protein CPAR01_06202 [Colletotrichum paranaense]|uniref:Uncharacterized protein n=2 Tax=Colletotrichum acutatum species complex TaxID=2707335 RepID=A0AAI9UIU5_9PEZI|nr:uncharacterized protein CPAR01_06202 [Colletotrichum paranaense]KAK1459268.1 hypothetical protein CMEL01_02267 [Colletotrichum melonis]KAK1542815.1 hypothetical protein CPAR01_06202 [Colletotrichum paranaense]